MEHGIVDALERDLRADGCGPLKGAVGVCGLALRQGEVAERVLAVGGRARLPEELAIERDAAREQRGRLAQAALPPLEQREGLEHLDVVGIAAQHQGALVQTPCLLRPLLRGSDAGQSRQHQRHAHAERIGRAHRVPAAEVALASRQLEDQRAAQEAVGLCRLSRGQERAADGGECARVHLLLGGLAHCVTDRRRDGNRKQRQDAQLQVLHLERHADRNSPPHEPLARPEALLRHEREHLRVR